MSEDGIQPLLERYADALRRGSVDDVLACFTADARVMAPGAPTAADAAVRGLYEQIFDALRLDIAFTVDDVVLASDTAFVLTRSTGTQTVLATGGAEPEANREAFVLVREAGDWRISRYLFNTVR